MLNIDELLKEYNKNDSIYINSVKRKYNEFLNTSDIPVAYLEHNIVASQLPAKLRILNDNIYDIVSNRYGYIFNVSKYNDTGKLSSMLLDTYFSECIKNDTLVENVIYVDTNLILEDYKKLMDLGDSDISMSLAHHKETLTKYIETAPCVIWDKFSYVNSNYDKQKLYNILLIRARRGLGNLFFIKNATQVLPNIFDEDTYNAMNAIQLVDISQQKISYKDEDTKGGTKW